MEQPGSAGEEAPELGLDAEKLSGESDFLPSSSSSFFKKRGVNPDRGGCRNLSVRLTS